MKRFNLAVLGALVLGVLFGLLLPESSLKLAWIGELYLTLLKMILLPLIISAILWAFCSPGTRGLGKVGTGGALFYVASSLLAAITAIALYALFMPASTPLPAIEPVTATAEFAPLGGLIAANPFAALFEGRILPVVTFTLLFAIALWQIPDPLRRHLGISIEAIYETMMTLTRWIILLTPLGAFSLIAALMVRLEAETFGDLAGFVLLVVGAGLFHALIVLPLLGWAVGRFNPWVYLLAVKEALTVAFVTASSAATLPVSLRSAQNAGVRPASAGLLLPLGATLNMDGSALYHALLALFLAHLAGVDLSGAQQLMLVGIVMLSSAGTAAIPGGGIAMMALVLSALGVEPVWLGLYLLIDRVLDNFITAVNVWGDLVAARAVDARFGKTEDVNA